MATTHLTREGYDKLLEELRLLKEDKLPAILERLKEAIAQGDISENSEYDTSMSDKELTEKRIADIEYILTDVEIIEHKAGGTVKYGSTVVVKDDKDKEHTFTIVGTGEVDVLSGTVSLQSPVGHAIKGKEKGDTIFVNAPSKRYQLTIVDVK